MNLVKTYPIFTNRLYLDATNGVVNKYDRMYVVLEKDVKTLDKNNDKINEVLVYIEKDILGKKICYCMPYNHYINGVHCCYIGAFILIDGYCNTGDNNKDMIKIYDNSEK